MACQWDYDDSCLKAGYVDGLDADVWDRALSLASDTMRMLTNNRVGTCPITIRPVTESLCGCGFDPHMGVDGRWYNNCSRHGMRDYAPLTSIDLPGPVGNIEALWINGATVALDNGDWTFMDGHVLVWIGDGPSPVPGAQNLNKPYQPRDNSPEALADCANTYAVTYSQSYMVDQSGQIAVALLAQEYVKACKPSGACSLPRGVTSVVRSGVSFTIEAGLFPNGLTNIELTDAYIIKWAPPGSPSRTATVFDPRQHRPRVQSRVPFGPSDGFGGGGFGE